MKKVANVEEYIANNAQYETELSMLREILNSTGLDETVKWGAPAYTFKGKNVVGIGAFKSYVGLWFHRAFKIGECLQVVVNLNCEIELLLDVFRYPLLAHGGQNHKELEPQHRLAALNRPVQKVKAGLLFFVEEITGLLGKGVIQRLRIAYQQSSTQGGYPHKLVHVHRDRVG